MNINDYSSILSLDNNGYYGINSVQGLKDMLGFLEDNHTNYKFKLHNNLDLTDESGFFIPYFTGEFDGANHTIANLAVNTSFINGLGMFGLNKGTINNLGTVNVALTGALGVGGLVGMNAGNINNSYAMGNVNGTDAVGGLVGYNDGNISSAYATGNVYGDSFVGGLVGWNFSGCISNAYATGKVSGTSYVGGLVGDNYNNNGRINNGYWNTTTSDIATSAGGTGLIDVQMKQQTSFSGWDFTNIWQINEGRSYPSLKAFNQQTVTPVIPTPTVIVPTIVVTLVISTPLVVLSPTAKAPTIVETKVTPVQPIIAPVQSVDSVTLDEPIRTPVQIDEPIFSPIRLIDSLILNQLMTQFSSIQTSTTFADWYYQQRLAKYNKEIEANFEQYKSLGYILKN